MKHLRRISITLFALLLIGVLPLTVQGQTTVAEDNGDNYTGDYIGENEGTGFNAWAETEFGGDDQGGTFIAEGDNEIEGSGSFAMFAGDDGSGVAVSRSLANPLTGPERYQFSFLIQLNLDPNAGDTAGFVLSEEDANDKTSVFDGQQLFIGIDGSGVWGFDDSSGYTAIDDGGGDDFSAEGGVLYRVTVDVIPEEGRYDLQVEDIDNGTESEIESGNLATSPGTNVATIGFAHGVTGSLQDLLFDDITVTEDPTAPLPVELTSFTAALDGTTAQLRWETASETDNAGFEVQHSAGNSDFEALDFVEGYGTTDAPRHYSFTVDNLEPGTHQFRLKQIDFDGTSELKEAQTVEVSAEAPIVLHSVAPNPVRSQGTLEFAVQEARPVTISLYNTLGQRIQTLYDGTPSAHQTQTVDIDVGNLPSGTYFIRTEGIGSPQTRSMTVVR